MKEQALQREGPYPTTEIPIPGMVPTFVSDESGRPDGEDSSYYQILSSARDGGRTRSHSSSLSSSFSRGEFDAFSQGNSGAIVQPDLGKDGPGSQ
ncbi:hypothetical protein SLA2020_221840 [Shorea laevis]